jgi:hypothetical protein
MNNAVRARRDALAPTSSLNDGLLGVDAALRFLIARARERETWPRWKQDQLAAEVTAATKALSERVAAKRVAAKEAPSGND